MPRLQSLWSSLGQQWLQQKELSPFISLEMSITSNFAWHLGHTYVCRWKETGPGRAHAGVGDVSFVT